MKRLSFIRSHPMLRNHNNSLWPPVLKLCFKFRVTGKNLGFPLFPGPLSTASTVYTYSFSFLKTEKRPLFFQFMRAGILGTRMTGWEGTGIDSHVKPQRRHNSVSQN